MILVALSLAVAACSVPRWPADGPMTSPYGLRMLGWNPDLHSGVDIGVPAGTPIRAMSAGTVVLAGPKRGHGLAVVIDHGRGWTSMYGHLSDVATTVGEKVDGRTVIGLSGNTGMSTGPHLHFEVRRWGRSVDPVPLLGGFPD